MFKKSLVQHLETTLNCGMEWKDNWMRSGVRIIVAKVMPDESIVPCEFKKRS